MRVGRSCTYIGGRRMEAVVRVGGPDSESTSARRGDGAVRPAPGCVGDRNVPTARVRHKDQLGFGRRRSILLAGSISDLPVADPAAFLAIGSRKRRQAARARSGLPGPASGRRSPGAAPPTGRLNRRATDLACVRTWPRCRRGAATGASDGGSLDFRMLLQVRRNKPRVGRSYCAPGFGGGIKGVRLGRDEVGGPCIRPPSAALGELTRLLDGGVLTTNPHATPRVGGGICGHGSAGFGGSPPLSFSFTRLARRPAFAGFCACRRNRSASDQRICKANKRRCERACGRMALPAEGPTV